MASEHKPHSHRKPKPHPLSSPTARVALTLALAGVTGVTTFEGAAQARPHAQPQRPDLTPAQVKAKVNKLHREAEEATEEYNGAKEKADKAEGRLERLSGQAARRAAKLNTSRDRIGAYAASQYRNGSGADPTLQLALSASPDDYLKRAAVLERAGSRQAAEVNRISTQTRELARLRHEAKDTSSGLTKSADRARTHKRTVQGKLKDAERLLDRLTARQRAKVLAEPGQKSPGRASRADTTRAGTARDSAPRANSGRNSGPPVAGSGQAASGRAARAVAFAQQAIGKPYVWGATGPGSFDCSGLTQAAWKAAGVSLPRTTYTQIDAGRRVARGGLAPGDLVFFYEGLSHVGLYIGGGKMIHAPRPGTAVRVAPIDEMPFAGATRPG